MDKQKQTILVVDDVAENIDILTNILQDDYRIKAAVSGQQALKIMSLDDKPDMVLLDIVMPEMDGYTVLKSLKEMEDTKDIPVIFISALGEIEDEAYGFSLGAKDYIIKPVSPAIVKARVQTHLALYKHSRELEEKNRELEKVVRVLENKLSRFSKPKSKQETLSKSVEKAVIEDESEEYFLDDHRQDLDDLIEEIDSAINFILLRNRFEVDDFKKAGLLLSDYAHILGLYPIFMRLGNGLSDFVSVLTNEDLQPEQENLEFALGCMESLIYTLENWHRQVFNHKLKDPNIFDNSMLADMETIKKALENDYDDDSDGMEFF